MKKILNMKSFQETLNAGMCGPASLKIVLDYYGLEKTEKELGVMCEADSQLGTKDVDIKKVAEGLGFEVIIKNNSDFEDIQYWLEKDIPVIVNWFTRGRVDYKDSDVADGHYSVVCGLDDEYIFLQDPEIGEIRKLNRDNFMSVWFDFTGKHIKEDELIIRQIIVIYQMG